MTERTPSNPSAIAQVTSSESSSRSSERSGRMNTSCSTTPTAKAAGVMSRIETNGSTWKSVKSV